MKERFAKLKESLRDIKILTAMQLQAKGSFAFLRDKKKFIYSVVFTAILFAVITAAFYLFFFLTDRLGLFSFLGSIPSTVPTVFFSVLLIFSFASSTMGLTKSLFLSQDNKLLLTLPATSTKVFFSKLIVYYVLELKKQFLYTIPLFVAFGIINGHGFLYYPYVFLMVLPLSLAVVIAASLASVPTMYAVLFLRKHRFLQTGLFMSVLAGLTVGSIYLISIIPSGINIVENFGSYYWKIEEFLEIFSKNFALFNRLTTMFTGGASVLHGHTVFLLSSLWTLLAVLAFCTAGILTNLFGIRLVFVYLASRQFEHKTSRKIKHGNPVLKPFASSLKKEALIILRAPGAFFNSFIFLVALPVSIYLLNQILNSIDVRYLGTIMGICVNAAVIFVVSLTNNLSTSAVLSIEGREISMLKTRPASFGSTLWAKLTIHLILMTVSVVTACAIFGKMTRIGAGATLLFTLTALLLNLTHIFLSVDLDITRPQYMHYHNGVFDGINKNEVISAIAAFAIAFIFFGIFTFFINENFSSAFIKVFIIALGLFVLRFILNTLRVKLLLKDI